MNRSETLELFVNEHVKKLSLEKILNLEEYYQKNKESLKKEFIESFLSICKKADNKENIGYITYSMLRTNLIENNKNYIVEVSDNTWFLDREKIISKFNSSFAFNFLKELEVELKELKKPYTKIKDYDIENIVLKEATKYNEYIVSLARYSLKNIEEIEEFKKLDLNEEFEVRVGEFRDITETVFKIDTRKKNPYVVKTLFEEKDEDDNHSYEVYRDLNLKEGDFSNLDFRYADFRGSDLSKSNLRECVLTGVNFKDCILKNIDFRDASIYEVNFENSDLSGSNFSRVVGNNGLITTFMREKWTMPGFEKVSFKNANLENVKFKNADLRGADFESANIKNTVFIGSDLRGAIFSSGSEKLLGLSENQKKNIIWR